MTQATAQAVTFQRETLAGIWPELMPLLKRHWAEITHYPDIPLDVDTELYEASERAGIARIYTVRTPAWELIGYAVFFVRGNAHYKSSLQATEDVIFIAPEQRKGGMGRQLVLYCDEQLRADGVQVVFHHVKTKHNFGPMLERCGYEHVEQGYWKRLDRPQGAES